MDLFFAFLVEVFKRFWSWLSGSVFVEGVSLFGFLAVIFILSFFLNNFLLRAK